MCKDKGMKKELIHLFLVVCISVFAIEVNAQIGRWHWQQPAVTDCRSDIQPQWRELLPEFCDEEDPTTIVSQVGVIKVW